MIIILVLKFVFGVERYVYGITRNVKLLVDSFTILKLGTLR